MNGRSGESGRTAPFSPSLAVASLSGEADAEWARTAAPHVGAAFLGGIAIDEESRAAARKLRDRGRSEFLPPDPIGFLRRQLAELASVPVRPGVNVRSATLEPVRTAAAACSEAGAILEVNAHCRQSELRAVGCGESLLRDPDRLCEYVEAAAGTGAAVSVKVRTEVPGVDLPATACRLAEAGAELLHVDAMDSEPVVGEVVRALEATDRTAARPAVIANNGVRDRETVREYLEHGADAVSVGRPSDRPELLARVGAAVEDYFAADSAAPP
ncbi:MAG: tRNA-dihydrouridine synthase [Haloferacaceae archaeon]